MTATRDLDRGTLVVHYRIEAVLGRGGMSVVYLAEDLRLKRRVALKLLAPALAEDERFRERFLSESELAASLDHANVIPVYEAGEAEGSLFIAMRYVEGSDLKALLRDGPLSEEQAVSLIDQVGGALDAAHERGLVHGDVKPSNVLIDERGHAYLADFGLTKRLTDERSPVGDAQLMGTIDYVAPELIRGDEVDGRADIYSLGCLLYECLTGRQPFKRSNDAAVLYAHLEDEPPTTGTAVDPVVAKALAKAPDERYRTGAELTAATREALGVAAPRRSRWPIAVAGVAAAVAVAALLSFFLFRDGGSTNAVLTGKLIRIEGDGATRSVRIGGDPSGVAAGGGRVWVTTRDTPGVWGVSAQTLDATHIATSTTPVGIATAGAVVYVLTSDGVITRIDLATPGPIAGSLPTPAEAIAGGPNGIWAAGGSDVVRIVSVSETVARVLTHTSLLQPSPLDEAHIRFDVTGIAIGNNAVWVTGDALDRRLFEIEPKTGRVVRTIPLPFIPSSVAADAHGVWVTAQLDDLVARIDPATNQIVKRIKVGREPMAVALSGHTVWVANALDDTVTRVDSLTNRATATIPIEGVPRAIVGDGSSAWVAADAR